MRPETELLRMEMAQLPAGPKVVWDLPDPVFASELASTGQPVRLLSWDRRLTRDAPFWPFAELEGAQAIGPDSGGHNNTESGHPQGAAILFMPKAKERLGLMLDCLAADPALPSRTFLIGEKRSGVESAAKARKKAGEIAHKLVSARHSQLWDLGNVEKKPFREADWLRWHKTESGNQVASLPGVFGHAGLDAGTRMLLGAWEQVRADWRKRDANRTLDILDFGAGTGTLSLQMLQDLPHARVDALDVDWLALHCCERTLKAQAGTDGRYRCLWSDGLASGRSAYDLVITNPPFHSGRAQDLSITQQFIKDCASQLRPRGQLLVVANRFLPYPDTLEATFGQFQVLDEDGKFRVYLARRRP